METRKERLVPDGVPRWARCYDNGGKTFDRYTVVYTNARCFGLRGYTVGTGMSEHPFHPQGFGQHFEYRRSDYDGKSGGKRIAFKDLPPDCQRLVVQDYKEYWGLKGGA